MKRTINILIYLSLLLKGYGQIDVNMPSSPIAPNVQSILKFDDFPVSHHTGIPDISIPIYTIALNDIKFPIKVSYNASGIKVNEESGTLGLGWEISSYGIISRSIVEANDFKNQNPILGYRKYFNNNIPDFLIPDGYIQYPVFHLFDYYATAPNMMEFSNYLNYFNKIPNLPSTVAELAPDVYSYNFNGFSGKFSLTHSGRIYKQSIDQVVIKYDEGNINDKDPDKWTITTPDGAIYTFSQKQLTEQRTSTMEINETSSWYLTEIKTMNGNVITFNYDTKSKYYYSISGLELEKRTSSMISEPSVDAFTRVLHESVVLKNIKFPSGIIEFSYEYDRQDLALDPRLTNIIIKNENEVIKKIEFIHNYFNANATNQSEMTSLSYIKDILNVPSTNIPDYYRDISDNWNKKRLKLLNINISGGKDIEKYSFTYNEESLPTKLSTARDHWGYHNGKNNNGLIPKQVIFNNLLGLETFEGTHGDANRSVDINYNQSFILDSMKLPTGGIVCYEYESNEQSLFYNDGDPNIDNYLSTKIGLDFIGSRSENIGALFANDFRYTFSLPGGFGTMKMPLTIELELLNKRKSIELGYELGIYIRKKSNKNIIYQLIDNMRLNSFQNGDDMNATKFILKLNSNITLMSAEEYELQIIGYSGMSKSSIFNSIKVSACTYKKAIPPATRVSMKTGGLRIKKITVLDNDKVVKEKIYEYSAPKLITNYPRYRYFRTNKVTPGSKAPLYTFYESSEGLRNKGCPIGYGSVTVYETNNLTANKGKSVYQYITKSDKQLDYSSRSLTKSEYESKVWGDTGREFDNTPEGLAPYSYISYAQNGLPTAESYYKYDIVNQNYILIKSINYEYDIADYGILWGIKRAMPVDEFGGWDNYDIQKVISVFFPNKRFTSSLPTAFIYPVINQQKINLKNKTETTNDDQSQQKIIKNTSFTYNNINNQIEEERISTSKGHDIVTKYLYPVDKEDEIFKKLVEFNRVNDIIEIITSSNSKIQQTRNIYSLFSNIPRLSGILENTGINRSLEQRISYHNYDGLGNYSYISKDDLTKIVYLWSYNGQYPIAEIKNATYDQIKSVLTEDVINRLSTSPEPLVADLKIVNDLRSNISLGNIMVTTYTYKPLVGMTSMTAPSGLTTYYEYDDFGRFKRTYIKEKDGNGSEVEKNIQSYNYHYRNQ